MSRWYDFCGELRLKDEEQCATVVEALSIDGYYWSDVEKMMSWPRNPTSLGGGTSPEEAHAEMAKDLSSKLGLPEEELKKGFQTHWWYMEKDPDVTCGALSDEEEED